MKDRYNNYREKNSINYKKIFLIFAIVVILSIFLLSIVVISVKSVNKFSVFRSRKTAYNKLLKEKNYLDLIKKMDNQLKNDPFNQEYLVFRGYAYFLLGEESKDFKQRKTFFAISLQDLRKSLAIGVDGKNIGDIYFCVGKIYYYFGEPYYYQSLKYFNRALLSGNKRKDLLYALGLLNSYIGDYSNSTKIFLEALKIEESELLLLAVASSYYKENDLENSKKYINRIIGSSVDPKIKEKSLFLMGEIFYKEKKLNDSLKYFNEVIKSNENNASAYFYRGEIYYYQNDKIKARSEWRKALDIDPSHIKALKRIY